MELEGVVEETMRNAVFQVRLENGHCIQAHLAGKLPLHEAELRIRAASGEWKWILTRGRIVYRHK